MAPSATSIDEGTHRVTVGPGKKPLKSSGSLNEYKHVDLTPVIGTEYPEVNIVDDLLSSPDADRKLRDLAIQISERGVVFFRAQDNLTNDIQKQLMQRLGELSGKPKDSTLHIHPVLNDSRELGGTDPHISTISSIQRDTLYKDTTYDHRKKKQFGRAAWHSDISFEAAPADYTSLRLTELPSTGGDTLWASGYEMYDRISAPFQKFLEGLDATHSGKVFREMAATGNFELHLGPRGSPENVGPELESVHPVVRTNPVTGWKSLYGLGPFVQRVNGVASEESELLLKWFLDLIFLGHDLTVRFKWNNSNDLAIWDNRSTFHTATDDYDGLGQRFGNRAVGIAEKPYFDPASRSRNEALAERSGQ